MAANLDNLFAKLGELSYRFSNLENIAGVLLSALIHRDPRVGMSLVSGMAFKRRLDALSCIAPFIFSDQTLVTELESAIALMNRAEDLRNQIVHSGWVMGGVDAGMVRRMRSTAHRRDGLQMTLYEKPALDEIQEAITAQGNASRAMVGFGRKVQDLGLLHFRFFGPREKAPSDDE